MSRARRRLELWAEMFAPASRPFLAMAPAGPELALDLGCASGHTTRLLAETVRPQRCVGFDTSAAHLEAARAGAIEGVEFIEHDVTKVPFPTGPADLVYCRFLLPHVPDPLAAVHAWASQLRPGGRILLDEVEQIRGDEDDTGPVRSYLDMAASLQERHGGHRSEVGPLLGSATFCPPLRCVSNQVVTLRPPARLVAPVFLLNLAAWRRDPSLADQTPALDRLHAELEAMAASAGAAPIAWRLRQVLLDAG
ncbi:MAG TPA: class I SAM-dependent methyltransferase [Candidatus Dormibacteraeota bacterium]|nr:class I SAM-dependent methyltransferase [Candidatus Dormibacteraeota bacterium]